MATDFFERQDQARRNTAKLVALFLLGTVLITAALYFIMVIVVAYVVRVEGDPLVIEWFSPKSLLLAGGASLLIIGGGSIAKIMELRKGGDLIAVALGGKYLSYDTATPEQRRLLNIVEEMAIASGVAAPAVYVLEGERAINAFAAGWSPDNAVIGVTRGAIEKFNRAQMQGVIAHEFSHILNGDMRTNIKLIGVLNGMLLISLLGGALLRGVFYAGAASGGSLGGRGKKDSGGGIIPLLLIAVALIVIGSIGAFFGKWIKSAVSRQREYLADASAVQFTRNPEGVAGALKTIGGYAPGARLRSPKADEMSHMFFGEAITSGLNSMFATHPPLAKRISRIDPSWDGTFPEVDTGPSLIERQAEHTEQMRNRKSSLDRLREVMPAGDVGWLESADDIGAAGGAVAAVSLIGMLEEGHMRHAQTMIDRIPEALRDAAHDPFSARAVVFGLLLHAEGEHRKAQLDHLKANSDQPVVRALARLLAHFDDLAEELRLPILDLAAPALRAMSPNQAQTFMSNVDAFIAADAEIETFEWAIARLLRHRLADRLGDAKADRTRHRYFALNKLQDEVSCLLSMLARAGHPGDEEASRQAFEAASTGLRLPNLALLPEERCKPASLGSALDELRDTAPRPKKALIHACARSIAADHEVTAEEAELFRAIASDLGAPTPPLLPEQPLV